MLRYLFVLLTSSALAQTGHLMQGAGAVNMSMGGAATAQPLDITGAMQWNPASLSVFNGTELKLDVGAFFSSPTLYSSLPQGALWPEDAFFPGSAPSPPVMGSTNDERGTSILPALAVAWGKEDSKHTFGVSAIGISGFGVTFPQETNLPVDANGNPNPNWDPNDSNPILYPQSLSGFGRVESDYMLLQVGFTWAFQVSEKFSLGLQPNFNYANLDLEPNPLAAPGPEGYPTGSASATGFGAQLGLFYDSLKGVKLGASYKTPQTFGDFDFGNGTKFRMDYPAIYSVGFGYSRGIVDFALDYRYVDYENTEGFKQVGWAIGDQGMPTGAVNGFGWQNISIVSVGLQLSAIERLPLRFGYTYSGNPIQEDLTMFSVPATAIIAHAFQFGLSYDLSERFRIDGVYHYGTSSGKTEGQILNPMLISPANPLGEFPGSSVAYDMTTSMVMIGLNFKLGAKDSDKDGVADKEDKCPDTPGLESLAGCPDADADGITDAEDQCPQAAGTAAMKGCPDSDGDGFPDQEDLCPEVAGLAQFNGCPDTDGDGVIDKLDDCPDQAGEIDNKGCPLVDSDGDGTPDDLDQCPTLAGEPENNGCPLITPQVQAQITDLARSIYFQTGKDGFTDETLVRLDALVNILKAYPSTNFAIEGHTDSTGSDKINQTLSEQRAQAVKDYLVEKGIPSANLSASGFGSSKPIAPNDSRKGRQANRRVEIRAM